MKNWQGISTTCLTLGGEVMVPRDNCTLVFSTELQIFQIYNLFLEIFKFREDKKNNVFREILKCFRKIAKFEFFAKQIIYLASPDHPL